MDYQSRSAFVIDLLANAPGACMHFEQIELFYTKEYLTSKAVSTRSLRMVLCRLYRMKKILLDKYRDPQIITLVTEQNDNEWKSHCHFL